MSGNEPHGDDIYFVGAPDEASRKHAGFTSLTSGGNRAGIGINRKNSPT